MTREEAIEQIYNIEYGHKVSNDDLIAFGLALEALENLQPTCNQLATDCISRQGAIDLWHKYQPYIAVKAMEYDNALAKLQSAQPYVPDTNVGDIISRQAAIAEFSCCELTPDGGIDVNYAIDFLMNMPSAQPEVIRCKDCSKRPYCRMSTAWAVVPDDDWFCGDAERNLEEIPDMRGEQECTKKI